MPFSMQRFFYDQLSNNGIAKRAEVLYNFIRKDATSVAAFHMFGEQQPVSQELVVAFLMITCPLLLEVLLRIEGQV